MVSVLDTFVVTIYLQIIHRTFDVLAATVQDMV